MTNNETNRTNDPSDLNSSALALRAAGKGPSRGSKVLFIAASAFGVAAMPGLADQLLSSLGTALVSTASAAEPNECPAQEVLPGYEEGVIKMLKEQGVELPEAIESHFSLFELSEAHDATIIRERGITLLVGGKGEVLTAPSGYLVFPDGVVAEIIKGGRIGQVWLPKLNPAVGYWAMCRTGDGGWLNCT